MFKIKRFRDNNFFIAFFLFFPFFLSCFDNIFRTIISNTYKIDTIICYLILLFFAFTARNRITKELRVKWIMWALFWILILATSVLNSPDPSLNMEVINYTAKQCIPAFIVITFLSNSDSLWKELKTIAYIMLILLLFETFILKSGSFGLLYDSKNQFAAYQAMIPATIFVISIFESLRWYKVLALLANLFLLVTFGERTPILIIFLLAIIMSLTDLKQAISRRKIIFLFCSMIIIIFLILFSGEMVYFLVNLMGKVDMSSRMIQFLLGERSATTDAGRLLIFIESINILKDKWVLGTGFINERFLLYNKIHWSTSNVYGMYPHNILLELLLQTGLFVGCILFLIVCRLTIKAYKLCKSNKSCFNLFMLFFFNGFFPLIASGSYINFVYFYYYVGYCLIVIRKRRQFFDKY